MSLINTSIQPFNTTAYHDGKFVPVSDANLKGQWSVVFFYPADFTFVCPTELGDLADHYDTFKALGVEIYAVSTDTHFAHKAWHDSSDTISKIRYPMLGDPTGAISRSFDVMTESTGLALRGTFVINPEGQIKVCEIHDDGIGFRSAAHQELESILTFAQSVRDSIGRCEGGPTASERSPRAGSAAARTGPPPRGRRARSHPPGAFRRG
jgi:peroxiredoxin (alkyl hydroperoxide reductase subunit C)